MKLAVAKRKPIPFRKQIRVPLVCLGTGILNFAVSRIAAALAEAERIPADSVFTICVIAAVLLFLLSGMLLLRKLKQDEIIRSAGYVVLYYFVIFVIGQEFAARAQTLPEWLLIPVWPFTYLHTGLLQVGFPRMFALAPALLAPLFYAMFGQPRAVEEEGAPGTQTQQPDLVARKRNRRNPRKSLSKTNREQRKRTRGCRT